MITAREARTLQESLGKNLKEVDKCIRKAALKGDIRIKEYTDIQRSEIPTLCEYLKKLGYDAYTTEEKHGLMIHIDWSDENNG